MTKPNKAQEEVLSTLIEGLTLWKDSRDFNSPTNIGDIQQELLMLYSDGTLTELQYDQMLDAVRLLCATILYL